MRVLIYKRTHTGDPDASGCFGVYDCMGAIRERGFDAVIGVGGIGREARAHGIDGKVNWIGIGPHKTSTPSKRGSEITFDHFRDFGTEGPDFRLLAPMLAERMYSKNVRHLTDGLHDQEHGEAMRIVAMAKDAPPSLRRVVNDGQACLPRWCLTKPKKMPDDLALVLDGEQNTILCFTTTEAVVDAEPGHQADG